MGSIDLSHSNLLANLIKVMLLILTPDVHTKVS